MGQGIDCIVITRSGLFDSCLNVDYDTQSQQPELSGW